MAHYNPRNCFLLQYLQSKTLQTKSRLVLGKLNLCKTRPKTKVPVKFPVPIWMEYPHAHCTR